MIIWRFTAVCSLRSRWPPERLNRVASRFSSWRVLVVSQLDNYQQIARLPHEGFRFVNKFRNFSAILTSSANDSAPIFRISRLRWTLTVASLVPISAAICLLSEPETTHGSTYQIGRA